MTADSRRVHIPSASPVPALGPKPCGDANLRSSGIQPPGGFAIRAIESDSGCADKMSQDIGLTHFFPFALSCLGFCFGADFVSPPISEALSFRALDRSNSTGCIFDALRRTMFPLEHRLFVITL